MVSQRFMHRGTIISVLDTGFGKFFITIRDRKTQKVMSKTVMASSAGVAATKARRLANRLMVPKDPRFGGVKQRTVALRSKPKPRKRISEFAAARKELARMGIRGRQATREIADLNLRRRVSRRKK